MAAMHEHQMAAMFAANAAAGMAAMQSLPGLAPALAGPSGPGPHLKDDKMEVREARGCEMGVEMVSLVAVYAWLFFCLVEAGRGH